MFAMPGVPNRRRIPPRQILGFQGELGPYTLADSDYYNADILADLAK